MSVAVVGGGLYGVTTALFLDKAGFQVHLYEQAEEILSAASWKNQWRLHRGYHYPRSPDTAASCRASAKSFTDRFPNTVIADSDHYYGIADDDRTKTTSSEFIEFCNELELEYSRTAPDFVDMDTMDLVVQVSENRIDPYALKYQCRQELSDSSVILHLGTHVSDIEELGCEYTVVATYAGINELLRDRGPLLERCKFELCEKILVDLPNLFLDTSLVVLDGPFMCVDPYGRTGNFLLGNVVHAVHESTVGHHPEFVTDYEHLLDKGLIESPDISNFQKFIETGTEFVPGLADAEYIGSFFTIRTVLADVEQSDKRPTIVERDGNVFKLFSGKLANCVKAAQEITTELEMERSLS